MQYDEYTIVAAPFEILSASTSNFRDRMPETKRHVGTRGMGTNNGVAWRNSSVVMHM